MTVGINAIWKRVCFINFFFHILNVFQQGIERQGLGRFRPVLAGEPSSGKAHPQLVLNVRWQFIFVIVRVIVQRARFAKKNSTLSTKTSIKCTSCKSYTSTDIVAFCPKWPLSQKTPITGIKDTSALPMGFLPDSHLHELIL